MPIPQVVRIDPRDLDKNKAIGVSIPFNGGGVFKSTFSTKDQIKSNLINLLLTNKGERVFNPEFGADIRRVLFEGITEDTSVLIQNLITTNVNFFIPEVNVIDVVVEPNEDNNSYNIILKYSLAISGTADQITVQFI